MEMSGAHCSGLSGAVTGHLELWGPGTSDGHQGRVAAYRTSMMLLRWPSRWLSRWDNVKAGKRRMAKRSCSQASISSARLIFLCTMEKCTSGNWWAATCTCVQIRGQSALPNSSGPFIRCLTLGSQSLEHQGPHQDPAHHLLPPIRLYPQAPSTDHTHTHKAPSQKIQPSDIPNLLVALLPVSLGHTNMRPRSQAPQVPIVPH